MALFVKKDKKRGLNKAVIDTAKEVLPTIVQAIRHAETSTPNSLRIEDGSQTKGAHKLDAAVEWLNDHIDIPLIPEAIEGVIFRIAVTCVVEVGQSIVTKHGGGDWIGALEDSFPDPSNVPA